MPVSISVSADAHCAELSREHPSWRLRKLDRSLCQVHSKRLHNDTHVSCSLQSPHYKGIGMITSVWKMPLNRSIHDTRIITPLDITLYCTVTSWWGWTHIHAELSWSQSELFCFAYFHNYVFAVSSVYGLILYLWHRTFVLLQGNWESLACCTFINKLKSPDFWQAVASL